MYGHDQYTHVCNVINIICSGRSGNLCDSGTDLLKMGIPKLSANAGIEQTHSIFLESPMLSKRHLRCDSTQATVYHGHAHPKGRPGDL